MIDLLDLIGRDTQLKRTSACHGGEYSGPCPLCRLGTNRFKVWPRAGRWACLGRKAGRSGCDRGGDAIQYLRDRDRLTYRAACERLGLDRDARRPERNARPPSGAAATPERPAAAPSLPGVEPPNPMWQAHARALAARCEVFLWSSNGCAARDYLHHRGLSDALLRAFHIGYNPQDLYEDYAEWGLTAPDRTLTGLSARPRHIWLPRGVTIPWFAEGAIWRLNIRRPLSPAQIAAGQAKYIGPAGFANALYNADALCGGRCEQPPAVAVLVEGEIDALTIVEALRAASIGVAVVAVATGSTAGARRQPWLSRLAAVPLVLVAFDHDPSPDETLGAGDCASAWWLATLPNAHRWQPALHDINTGAHLAAVSGWLANALAAFRALEINPDRINPDRINPDKECAE